MPRKKSGIDVRIVHAARDRFLHDGVDGASLREIARAARTSIGMVYYYFPSKDELFLAVLEEVYAGLLADLEVALRPDVPFEQRLDRLFQRFARLEEDEWKVVRLVLREAMVSSRRRAHVLRRFLRGHVPLVLGTLADGVRAGRLDEKRPLAALGMATFVLALFPQLFRRLAGDELRDALPLPSAPALATALHEILLGGIGRA